MRGASILAPDSQRRPARNSACVIWRLGGRAHLLARIRAPGSYLRKRVVFIIAGRANQLGNQLFMFGALIACAAEHETSVAHLVFGDYADWFETTARDLFCRFPARRSLLAPTQARRGVVARWGLRFANSLARGRAKALQGKYIQHIESGYESTLVTRAGVVNVDANEFRERLRAPWLVVFQGPLVRDNIDTTLFPPPRRRRRVCCPVDCKLTRQCRCTDWFAHSPRRLRTIHGRQIFLHE